MGVLCSGLRISNKVQDNNGFVFDVVSIFEDGTVYCDFEGNEGDVWEFDNNNPCQGIPLTEEILLKCGFDNFEGWITHEDCDFILECEDNSWEEPSIDVIFEGRYLTCIENLHQLQNLYYYLVGKELKVKL